jgi:hypothetical protein
MIQNNDWDTLDLNSLNMNSVFTVSTPLPNSVLVSGATGSTGWSTISASTNLTGDMLNVKGDATFDGDVKIKGKSIADSLERIEARLAILRPNEELEEKWDNLRALRNAYMELEAEIKEKEAMWGILKR